MLELLFQDDDSSNASFCLGDDTPIQNNKPRDAVSVTGPENDAVPVSRGVLVVQCDEHNLSSRVGIGNLALAALRSLTRI